MCVPDCPVNNKHNGQKECKFERVKEHCFLYCGQCLIGIEKARIIRLDAYTTLMALVNRFMDISTRIIHAKRRGLAACLFSQVKFTRFLRVENKSKSP